MPVIGTTSMRPLAPGRLTVGTAAVQGPNVSAHGFVVKSLSPAQTVYVGINNGVTAATGYPMADLSTIELNVTNLNQLWFIASAASQTIAYFPFVFN